MYTLAPMKITQSITAGIIGWALLAFSAGAFTFSLVGVPDPVDLEQFSFFSVVDYGAIGDGAVDDTGAIQAAINAVAAQGGGVVLFPEGTYAITSPLELSTWICLLGENDTGCVVEAAADLPSMVRTPDGSGAQLTIENLIFDGSSDGDWQVDCVLDLKDFLGSRVAHVAIRNTSGDGIYSRWTETLDQSWVDWFVNLDIAVDGYALRLGSSDCFVDGVHVDGGLGIREEQYSGNLYRNCIVENCINGISVANLAGQNLRISVADSSFLNNRISGISFGFETPFDSYATIDGCVFEGNGEADVFLGNCNRIVLRRNEFRTASPSCGQAINTTGVVDYVSLTDNRFSGTGQFVSGTHSVAVNNLFGCTEWSDDAGAFPREDLFLLPESGRVLNVKDYGAVGNAFADDTEALQATLDAARSGDTVYLPTGGYKITSTLRLNNSGITVLGDGYGNIGSKIVAGTNLVTMLTTPSMVSNVRIAKVNFVGKSSLGYTVEHALFLSRMTDSLLDHVRGFDLSGNGIVMGIDSARNRIRGCNLAWPGGWGLLLEGSDCVVDGLYCSGGHGVRISGLGGHQILNSHIDWADIAALYFVNPAGASTDVMVRNCYFDLNEKAVSFDYDTVHAVNARFECCLFRVNDVDIDLRNATHVSLTGGTHRARVQGTVHLQASGTVDDLEVIGNVFENRVTVPGTNSVVYGNTMP